MTCSSQYLTTLPASQQTYIPPAPASVRHVRPTPRDILRYRYQHGANLGSIFILEQWLFGGMYDEGVSGSSELDAINA